MLYERLSLIKRAKDITADLHDRKYLLGAPRLFTNKVRLGCGMHAVGQLIVGGGAVSSSNLKSKWRTK